MQSLTCRRVNQAVIFWHIVQLARFIFRFFTPNLFPHMAVWPLSKRENRSNYIERSFVRVTLANVACVFSWNVALRGNGKQDV